MKDEEMPLTCAWCGEAFERSSKRGPEPRYCSAAHRQRSYEARRSARVSATPDELSRLVRSLEQFNRIGSKLASITADLRDSSALLGLADQLSSITQQFDYTKILGDMPNVSRMLEFDSTDLSAQFASIADRIDFTKVLADLPNRAGSLAAQLLPDTAELVLNELVASVDLAPTLASIDWTDGFTAVVNEIGCLEDLLAGIEEDDHASLGLSTNMHPAAPLVAAAFVIALVMGPTLFVILTHLAVQLAATADVTLKLATEIGSKSPHLQGAAYAYFVAETTNQILAAVRHRRDRRDTTT